MEIITIMVEGELQHSDSMGNTAPLRLGEVQRMSAGTGLVHSEQNVSEFFLSFPADLDSARDKRIST
jgi:redox-sensitive bicupin YhaK (pirin superfamily)